ncbi:DNA repair protein rad14 [Microbotryomycetes sp. JL201]|nr:DNA repair protein rad14 [Microbotryomycetes sp. JL201]
MVLYSEDPHTYNAPLPYICLAHNLRFPSPYSNHVISSDVVSRAFVQKDDSTTVLRTTKLILKRGKVPAWAPPMIQKIGTSWVLEETEVDLERFDSVATTVQTPVKQLRTKSRNLDHKTILEVCEWQTFQADKTDSTRTESTTLSRVTSEFGFWPLRNRIEKFGLSRIPKAIDKSRSGIELVATLLMQPSTSSRLLNSGPLKPFAFNPVPSPLALAVRAKLDEARAALHIEDRFEQTPGTKRDELEEPGRIWRERWRAAAKRGITRFKDRFSVMVVVVTYSPLRPFEFDSGLPSSRADLSLGKRTRAICATDDHSTMDPSLSPEKARLMAEARMKAKAAIQERDRQARQAQQQLFNSNGKRPLQAIPADSTSPTNPNKRTVSSSSRAQPPGPATKALQDVLRGNSGAQSKDQQHFQGPDKNAPLKNMIGTYVEYDLATLKNSKGGFLLDSEEDDPRRIRERQQQELLAQKRRENAQKQGVWNQPGTSNLPNVDQTIRQFFGMFVCTKCKTDRPDEYSLLTKTECKEDYLLTESELRDEDLLPHMLKPNPHRPTYSNMMLFLRCQVESFAFSDKKWGSPENLDAEFERRQSVKQDKKNKKFTQKLAELRTRTRTNVWHKRKEGEHQHVFGHAMVVNEKGDQVQRCEECGFEVEVEVF